MTLIQRWFGLFTFTLLLSTTAVTAQTAIDIAVLLPDSTSSARWEHDDRRFLTAAFEAAEVTYSIVNAEGDRQTQIAQAEQAITNGARVLLFVNLDGGSGAAIIAKAHEAGVLVIDYDRLTTQGEGADYYVSFDSVEVGRLIGEGLIAAVEAAQTTGSISAVPKIAILNGSPTDNNARLLAEGYHAVLRPLFEAGTWELAAEQDVPDWDNQQALIIFEQMQTNNPDIDAAIAANDGLAQAMIAARMNAGLPFIPLTGQDATVGGIQNVLAGRQSLTVYKPIQVVAEAAAALAVALVRGDNPNSLINGTTIVGTSEIPSVLLHVITVTADNVADTVIADGFRTWAEVCVGEFVPFCPAEARPNG